MSSRTALFTAAFLLLASSSFAGASETDVREDVPTYSNQFKESYPTIEKVAPVIPPDVPLEDPVVVWALQGNRGRKATLVRSNGGKVVYDKEIAVITIDQPKGEREFLQAKGFRTIGMKWINDRLLYISEDIGHTASVEAIFDADQKKWVYQQSIWWHLN